MLKKITIFFILIISLITLFISSYNITVWMIDKNKTKQHIEKIYDNVVINEVTSNKNENSEETTTQVITNTNDIEKTNKNNKYYNYMKINLIDVDFSKLKNINNEIKGWIKVEGTNINYPFVQTNNNSYYLTHSFDKSYNKAGWVFMDYRNDVKNLNKNTIFYAHGRADNTMFGSLRKTLKSSWFNNKNNHIIRISTENENSSWQIFSVYKIPTTSDYLQIYFSDLEFEEFANKIISRSVFNFNTKINTDDKIITLSTCHNSIYKIVMHAKLIKINSK